MQITGCVSRMLGSADVVLGRRAGPQNSESGDRGKRFGTVMDLARQRPQQSKLIPSLATDKLALARRSSARVGTKAAQPHVAAPEKMLKKKTFDDAPGPELSTEPAPAVPAPEPAGDTAAEPSAQGQAAGTNADDVNEGKSPGGSDVGLASNKSLSEHEVAEFWLSADAVEEEDRLAAARLKTAEKEKVVVKVPTPGVEPALAMKRFAALDELLNKSEMYTQFLSEQLKIGEEEMLAAGPEPTAAATREFLEEACGSSCTNPAKGTKRGRTGKAKQAAKKQEEEAAKKQEEQKIAKPVCLTPTQEFLPLMTAELRDYQLKGVRWLASLHRNGLNGILADQMGLGKTIQTIGFLSLLNTKGVGGPFLVVGPLSTLPNWVNEFHRFCPSLPPLLYHGDKKEREHLRRTRLKLAAHGKVPEGFPVIVTSFEIVIADAKFLQQYKFKYMVVDEGHRLKNFNCKLIRELKLIPAENRLLLSGTPLQNNLSELWSLLNFLMPDALLAAEQRARAVSKLHGILKPFVLRRLKSDVEISLPGKMEVILYAGMSKTQENINRQLLEGSLLKELVDKANKDGMNASAAGALTRLSWIGQARDVIADAKFLQQYKFKHSSAEQLVRAWSLLNFLMPDVFDSLQDFEDWFDFGSSWMIHALLAAEQRARAVSKLHGILKPFVLRRLKSDVEISLPERWRSPLRWNKELVDKANKDGMNASAAGALNNMRKNCNHPDLITSAFSRDMEYPTPEVLVEQGGKLQLLDRLLKKLHAGGHKVLIFSQMTKMLDLLESFLDQQGHKACRIDGSVPWQVRQENIHEYNNNPKTWLFLLSTRAGGLGINLTAADTAIIYDSDWNPHADLQAMDRCHRIGQTRPVLVFRLATANSVEGKMLKKAASKMALEKLVIKKGAFKELSSYEAGSKAATSMSASELIELLRGVGAKSDVPQSGVVSDDDLAKLMDRKHLELGSTSACTCDASGVGFERVIGEVGGSMLDTIS
eukprot:gene24975-10636_t